MKIDFARSGGVGGLRLGLKLDTERLPEEESSRLRRLVETSGFLEYEQTSLITSSSPDRFEYRLTIESQVWGSHSIVLAEAAVPDEMRPLLEHLTKLAMSVRQSAGPAEKKN